MATTDVLVITGGAGAMGLACARTLANRGHPILVDLGEGQLDEARRALSAEGASVETMRWDVTSAADTAAVADRARASGRFRCLVHTAGVSPEMADGRTVMEVDLIDTPMGRLELDRQPVIPLMVEVTPVKRPESPLPGRPEDIAALVGFLESDAAAFISGCDISVDGGLVGAGKHMLGMG